MTAPEQTDTLAELAADYWEHWLAAHPLDATAFGERRFDDRLSDISREGQERERASLAALERRLAALPPDDGDWVTRAALSDSIASELAFVDGDHASFTVEPMNGPQVAFLNVPSYQAIRTPADGAAMLERWRAMPGWIDTLTERLRGGAAEARTPVEILVRRVIDQLDALAARPIAEWPLLSPLDALPAHWPSAERDRFAADLTAAVADGIAPAFARHRAFLTDELLPVARPDERVGLAHLPGGLQTYRELARAHTSVDTPPEELHRIGLAEVERIDAELVELGGRVLGTPDLPETLSRLRADPALHFTTRDEVYSVAASSLARALEAIPGWFGRLPKAACEVLAMGAHEEKHSTIAYYREPAGDGSRPGQYYVNTSDPETRPRYEAEALAFHEAIPGHHLQIAIAQELTGLPAFRRFWGSTAYVEGWGLYTERLADEMGLYSGELDRFGILSFDAWRACRLVIDTGMHALGWSRSRAIAFMTVHTALSENNIANEVDRYIGWPGQALAYKVGQLELLGLREQARRRLGAAFDIRRFHDAVLAEGALPLPVLRQVVERELAAPV